MQAVQDMLVLNPKTTVGPTTSALPEILLSDVKHGRLTHVFESYRDLVLEEVIFSR